MTQLIHNYHPATREFVSTASADASPLEPGVFLIPACATDVAPPALQAGEVAVFGDGFWVVEVDTRGAWFDAARQLVQIEAIGADVSNLTRTPPPSDAHDLADGQWVLNPERAFTLAKISFTGAVQKRLDDFARTRGYDDIKSLVTYAGDPDPQFDSEGSYGKIARSETWSVCRALLVQIQAGQRPMPTSIADIEADLPELDWPA